MRPALDSPKCGARHMTRATTWRTTMGNIVLSPKTRRPSYDQLRQTFTEGKIMMTAAVDALPSNEKAARAAGHTDHRRVRLNNDPHHEHDLGAFEVEGQRYFWKLGYYSADLESGSEDPRDPAQTTRVLTIMRSPQAGRNQRFHSDKPQLGAFFFEPN